MELNILTICYLIASVTFILGLKMLSNPAKARRGPRPPWLHRLLPHVPTLQRSCAVIAIAGMEGALPSVIGGLVACPVFAVPTSVGYGASLGGIAALLGMLNSCANSVSVVNIDNGYGAGCIASMINHL